jgi:hypothetical protein
MVDGKQPHASELSLQEVAQQAAQPGAPLGCGSGFIVASGSTAKKVAEHQKAAEKAERKAAEKEAGRKAAARNLKEAT